MTTDILFRNAGIRSENRKFKALESEFNKVRSKGIYDTFSAKMELEIYDINQIQANVDGTKAQIARRRAAYAGELSQMLLTTIILLIVSAIAAVVIIVAPELSRVSAFVLGGTLIGAFISFGGFVSRERYFKNISTYYYYLGEDEALLAQMTSKISAI